MHIVEEKGFSDTHINLQCERDSTHAYMWHSSDKTYPNEHKRTSSQSPVLQLVIYFLNILMNII